MATALSPGGYVRQGQRGTSPPRSVNVQVAVRCRPINERERSHGERAVLLCDEARREVVFNGPPTQRKPVSSSTSTSFNGKKTFTYDHVFAQDATQANVYDHLVEPIVDEVLQGYNCTVFAYGQTGTGKTHTMEGRRSAEILTEEDRRLAENAGIIPRAVKQIFDHLRSLTDEHSVRVSHLELYNEQLTDLLSPDDFSTDSLRVYEDPQKGTFVQGLDDTVVRSEEEIFAILDKSATKRKTAETLMNKYSSRSHSIFSITIHIKESTPEGADLLKVGKLNLVDLAGSENVGRSGAVKGRAREAGNINQSLLTLGRVITALVDRHPHIPYRDSKLTRLLQESLGGRNKTCIIATVTPASNSFEETASTLDYAYRAKSIKNRPTVNQMIAKNVLLKEYTEEITKLKRELDTTRAKNGVYLPPEEYEKMEKMSQSQGTHISDLETKTEEYEKKINTLKQKVDRVQDALARDQKILANTRKALTNVTVELKDTKEQLDVTTQQRDENGFLVKNHVATEQQLFQQGVDVQETLSNSLADVESLQVRVDVRSALEKENVDNLANLKVNVTNQVSTIRQGLEKHRASHKEQMETSSNHIEEAKGILISGFSDVTSQFDTLRQALLDQEKENLDASTKQDELLECEVTKSSTVIKAHLETHTQVLSDKNTTINNACQSVSETFSNSQAAMSDMMSSIKTHSDEQEAQLKLFIGDQNSMLTTFEKSIEGLIGRQKVIVDNLVASNTQDGKAQMEALQKSKADILARMASAMDEVIGSAGSRVAEKADADRGFAVGLETERGNVVTAVMDAGQSLSKASTSLHDWCGERMQTLHVATEASSGKHVCAVDSGTKMVGSVSQEVDAVATAYGKTRSESESLLDTLSEAVGTIHGTRVAQHEAQASLRGARVDGAGEGIQNRVKAASTRHDVTCAALGAELQRADDMTAEVTDSVRQTLDVQVEAKVVELCVAVDGDAESRPARRDWPARAILARTRHHTSLVHERRRDKGGQASDVGLPDFGQDVERTPGKASLSDGDECERMSLEEVASRDENGDVGADDTASDAASGKDEDGAKQVADATACSPSEVVGQGKGKGQEVVSGRAKEDGRSRGGNIKVIENGVVASGANEGVLSDMSNSNNSNNGLGLGNGRKIRTRSTMRRLEPGIKKPSSIPAPRTRHGGRRLPMQ